MGLSRQRAFGAYITGAQNVVGILSHTRSRWDGHQLFCPYILPEPVLQHSVEERHFSPSSFRKDSEGDSHWAEWVMWLALSQSVWSGGWGLAVCLIFWVLPYFMELLDAPGPSYSLYISCPKSRISHFPKAPSLLPFQSHIENQDLGARYSCFCLKPLL